MFERLNELYKRGRIKESHLQLSVSRGWITQEECDYIKGL